MTSPPTCSGIRVAKALSISRSALAFRTLSSSPSVRAATCRLVDQVSAFGFVGLTSAAIVVAVGTTSCSNSNIFGTISTFRKVTPVRLPPGRFRLATRPICTGSAMVVKTIGMVVVAAFAAIAEGVVKAAITDTWR
jgi:hypothetical protein